jgi:hypothetical protein
MTVERIRFSFDNIFNGTTVFSPSFPPFKTIITRIFPSAIVCDNSDSDPIPNDSNGNEENNAGRAAACVI